MGSISDIENDLHSIEDRVASHTEYVERARNEIVEVMNKAQKKFGKDQNGQNAVMAMSQALTALSSVDGVLYTLKSDILKYIGNLRK